MRTHSDNVSQHLPHASPSIVAQMDRYEGLGFGETRIEDEGSGLEFWGLDLDIYGHCSPGARGLQIRVLGLGFRHLRTSLCR